METKKTLTTSDLEKKFQIIAYYSREVFSEVSEDYRQKLVYHLLGLIKCGDKENFLWTLLRIINARKGSEEARKLVKVIKDIYNSSLSRSFFEKMAYNVIMGIMTSQTKEGGQENE